MNTVKNNFRFGLLELNTQIGHFFEHLSYLVAQNGCSVPYIEYYWSLIDDLIFDKMCKLKWPKTSILNTYQIFSFFFHNIMCLYNPFNA